MSTTPLTPSDLRAVADALEPLEFLPALTRVEIIGRVEVYRPDGDDVIGWFERNEPAGPDTWFGFVAKGADS